MNLLRHKLQPQRKDLQWHGRQTWNKIWSIAGYDIETGVSIPYQWAYHLHTCIGYRLSMCWSQSVSSFKKPETIGEDNISTTDPPTLTAHKPWINTEISSTNSVWGQHIVRHWKPAFSLLFIYFFEIIDPEQYRHLLFCFPRLLLFYLILSALPGLRNVNHIPISTHFVLSPRQM